MHAFFLKRNLTRKPVNLFGKQGEWDGSSCKVFLLELFHKEFLGTVPWTFLFLWLVLWSYVCRKVVVLSLSCPTLLFGLWRRMGNTENLGWKFGNLEFLQLFVFVCCMPQRAFVRRVKGSDANRKIVCLRFFTRWVSPHEENGTEKSKMEG